MIKRKTFLVLLAARESESFFPFLLLIAVEDIR